MTKHIYALDNPVALKRNGVVHYIVTDHLGRAAMRISLRPRKVDEPS
ncbi:MAG: hypothetical protein M1136_10375 [Chloroflexi bacterium]|nr:hypothetical protein [Chloroflexota bacterium]MCL5076036.1 hypothetical protein [Chloroflexota bacterium]